MALGDKISNLGTDPVLYNPGSFPYLNHECDEAASQVYTIGSLLKVDTSNDLTEAAAAQDAGDVILAGFAAKDATGVTGTIGVFWAPEVGTQMIMQAGANGVAATVTATLYPMYDNFDLYSGAGGAVTVNSSTETNPKVKVVGYVKDVNGDYTDRLIVIPYIGNETDKCGWASIADTV